MHDMMLNKINKRDYLILEILIERECFTPVASLSISNLINISNMSKSKVRSVKDNFIMLGYIAEGSKDGNNKTFYITSEGMEHFKLMFCFDDEKINEIIDNYKDRSREEE